MFLVGVGEWLVKTVLKFKCKQTYSAYDSYKCEWSLVYPHPFYSPDIILCGWLGSKHQLTNHPYQLGLPDGVTSLL